MKYSRIVFFLVLLVSLNNLAVADENKKYYHEGKQALSEKKHIKALKYLFAFKVLKEESLKKPKFKSLADELDVAIKEAEDNIRASMVLSGSTLIPPALNRSFKGGAILQYAPENSDKYKEVLLLQRGNLDRQIKLEEMRK